MQKNLMSNFTRFELNALFNLIHTEKVIYATMLSLSECLEEHTHYKAKCHAATSCALTDTCAHFAFDNAFKKAF